MYLAKSSRQLDLQSPTIGRLTKEQVSLQPLDEEGRPQSARHPRVAITVYFIDKRVCSCTAVLFASPTDGKQNTIRLMHD